MQRSYLQLFDNCVYLASNITLHSSPLCTFQERMHSLCFYGNTAGFHYNHWDLAPHTLLATASTSLDNLKGIESDFLFRARQIAEYGEACVLWKEND